MRSSLRVLVPGIIVILFLFYGLFLVLISSYFFYQNASQDLTEKEIFKLRIIKDILYNETTCYRKNSNGNGFDKVRRSLITKMASDSTVVFLRIVEPLSGKVLVSNREEEIGQIFKDLPSFSQKPFFRQGRWQGEKIFEFSIQGSDMESLWLGVTLKPIKEATLKIIFQMAILIFLFTLIIGFSLYFVFYQIIFKPLYLIFQTIEEVREGNLETGAPVFSRTEIGELATAFNEMVMDFKKSCLALEEAKTVLEIKIQAKTGELKELVQKQEEIIKERTREIQRRIEELEKFQRLAVGRELKMIELKKALKRSQEEIKKLREVGKND